jgi:predicted  nucleic acid-binding Zn-ribbon protein
MKTVEDLKTQIKQLSSQTVEFSKKATEFASTNNFEQAKYFRQQAKDTSKQCQVLIEELNNKS